MKRAKLSFGKNQGGQWENKIVFNSPDYPTLGLKLLDSQRMLSWEANNSIFLWLEKNGSWKPNRFSSNRYGPFDSHCDIECLDDHHFLSWDDAHIFVWTQKDGEWMPEKIDVFPDCELPDDYAEEPVAESELDEEQSAFDLNPLLINSCRQQPSLTSEALGIGQLFGRHAEVDGSDVNEVSEADSEISDSASLTSSEGSSPAYSINGVCKMDSKTVAYWGERQLMLLKQDDGGHWKSERLSEFDNSINKVRLHPEGYLVVLSGDDNGNSTISSVNIIEEGGKSLVSSVIARVSSLWDMSLLPDGRVVTADKNGNFTVWWEGGSKETWFPKKIGEHGESKPWFKVQTDGSILSWAEKSGIKHWFECSTDWIINSIGPALDSENIEIIDDCYISARVKSPEHGVEADDLVLYHLHPSTEGVDEKIIDV